MGWSGSSGERGRLSHYAFRLFGTHTPDLKLFFSPPTQWLINQDNQTGNELLLVNLLWIRHLFIHFDKKKLASRLNKIYMILYNFSTTNETWNLSKLPAL
jgi:hypothetical protein